MTTQNCPETKGKRYGDRVVEDEIMLKQTGYPRKCICLQKMRFDNNRVELRLGFYIYNEQKEQWVWGRNAVFVPPDDFKALVKEATDRGWLEL